MDYKAIAEQLEKIADSDPAVISEWAAVIRTKYLKNAADAITALLARAEAAEARVLELETTHRTEICESGYDCVELGQVRKTLEEAEARAEKAERCIEVIEGTFGDDFDLERIRELVEADKAGRVHIGRCVECSHYEGLAVCEYLGDCGGTNWICGWFEPKKSGKSAMKGEQDG